MKFKIFSLVMAMALIVGACSKDESPVILSGDDVSVSLRSAVTDRIFEPCECGIFNQVEKGNGIFLNLFAPDFVLFKDGQIDGLAVWVPDGSTLTWPDVRAQVFDRLGGKGWWSEDVIFFTEPTTFGNHVYSVLQGEDGWYAAKSGDEISNTVWFSCNYLDKTDFRQLEEVAEALYNDACLVEEYLEAIRTLITEINGFAGCDQDAFDLLVADLSELIGNPVIKDIDKSAVSGIMQSLLTRDIPCNDLTDIYSLIAELDKFENCYGQINFDNLVLRIEAEISELLTECPADIDFCNSEDFGFAAGQKFGAGTITVANDNENLYVIFTTTGGWKMKKTHLYVGSDAGKPKNASPGQFPYQQSHGNGTTKVTYTIPLASFDCLVVAAHAELVKYNAAGEVIASETGWGGNLLGSYGHNNWAMKIDYCPIPCGDTPPPPRSIGPSYGSVTATNAGNVPAILAGLNPKNGNPFFGDKKEPNTPFVVPNSNHFVFAALDRAALAAGVALDFVVGNKYDIVGAGLVKLEGNNLVVTIDDFAEGSFGVIAFNQLPVFNNGNIHSQKEADLKKLGATTGFNHNNVLTIPCPAGDTIYLYIHCGTIQFYLD